MNGESNPKRFRPNDNGSSSTVVNLAQGGPTNKMKLFPFTDRVPEGQRLDELRKAIFTITGETFSSKLPGPLPHTLTRATLPTVLNNEYWVCEKSDGIRAMMYSDNTGSYLVDRCCDFHKIRDQTGIFSLLAPKGPTLVDGEVIVNYFDAEVDTYQTAKEACARYESVDAFEKENENKKKKYILCVFDTIQINGEPCVQRPLLDRLKGVAFVKQTILKTLERRPDIKEEDLPLRVESKMFRRAQDVSGLVPYVHPLGTTDYMYFDPKKRIKSLNDGVIFTPQNNNYLHKKDPSVPIYKFKWPGLHTVDFLVQKPLFDDKQRVKLITEANPVSSGRAVSVVFTLAELESEDVARLEKLLEGRDEGIVEFAFDANHGRWRPKLLRGDKDRPNFLTTVANCFEAMADGLTFDEVKKILRPPTNK